MRGYIVMQASGKCGSDIVKVYALKTVLIIIRRYYNNLITRFSPLINDKKELKTQILLIHFHLEVF